MNNSAFSTLEHWSLTDVGRAKESNVVELSKPVSQLVPRDLNRIADSKDNNFIVFY